MEILNFLERNDCTTSDNVEQPKKKKYMKYYLLFLILLICTCELLIKLLEFFATET